MGWGSERPAPLSVASGCPEFRTEALLICPTGWLAIRLSSPLLKNFLFFRLVETALSICHPVPIEGRFAIVTNVGRDAVDADGAERRTAQQRTAKSCGSDASTLAFKSRGSIRLMTVTTKPDHRGERGISRKPLRGECRTFPA